MSAIDWARKSESIERRTNGLFCGFGLFMGFKGYKKYERNIEFCGPYPTKEAYQWHPRFCIYLWVTLWYFLLILIFFVLYWLWLICQHVLNLLPNVTIRPKDSTPECIVLLAYNVFILISLFLPSFFHNSCRIWSSLSLCCILLTDSLILQLQVL